MTPCPDKQHMHPYDCKDKQQCWEPCGELGKSAEHARPGQQENFKTLLWENVKCNRK